MEIKNTKFFHAITKQRRARNHITKLKSLNGGWAESKDGIEKVASEYFQNLFKSSQPRDFKEALRYITAKVTLAMNTTLTRSPTDKEIKKGNRWDKSRQVARSRRYDEPLLSTFLGSYDNKHHKDGESCLWYELFRHKAKPNTHLSYFKNRTAERDDWISSHQSMQHQL